jgi:hypothetical protein
MLQRGVGMKVSRAIFAGTAATQFGTLIMTSYPQTRTLGIILGVLNGAILLLLSWGIYPAQWQERKRTSDGNGTRGSSQ